MARNITLTLGAGMGADLGPNFNLTANVGSVTPSTATKSELTAGKSVSVDDAATQVTITSTGTCTNAATQTIPCAGGTTTSTTSTTSTTTTTTLAPVTMYWDLTAGNGGGGTLSVRNGSNVEIFSTSTTAGATSGTFVTNAGQLPLTVIGAWTAGSGNIVRYRICDSTPSEIYYSGDINSGLGELGYLLSPTPTSFHVYLSSGVSTYPVNCDGSPGVPTTTTTTTTTAAPLYKTLLVNVGSPDRAASDDGFVYFSFNDALGDPYTLSYNTNKSNFNTGVCVNQFDSFNVYILVGGNPTAVTASSVAFGTTCVP